jgi:hypothetical protein
MIKKVYLIKDKKIGYLDNTMMTASSKGLAIRFLYNILYGKNNDLWKYPEDFKLCEVGSIDNETGEIIPLNTKITKPNKHTTKQKPYNTKQNEFITETKLEVIYYLSYKL